MQRLPADRGAHDLPAPRRLPVSRLWAIATVAVAMLVGVLPAGAQDLDELEQRKAEIEAQQAEAQSQLDGLGDNLEGAQSELAATNRRIDRVQARLDAAQRDLDEAERQADEAAELQRRSEARVERLRGEVKAVAVRAFVEPSRDEQMRLLESDDLGAGVRANTLRRYATGRREEVIDEFRAEGQDVEAAKEYARRVGRRAAEQRAKLAKESDALAAAEADQQALVDALDDELGRRATELSGLQSEGQQVDEQIEAEQARLAAELEEARKAAEARQKAEAARAARAEKEAAEQARAEAAARASAAPSSGETTTRLTPEQRASTAELPAGSGGSSSAPSSSGASSGSGSSGGATTGRPATTSRPPTTAAPTSGPSGSDIVSVGGIRVHRSIAGNLRRLLDAARADGIVLGGGGYRSTAGQIQTRRNNCGSSYYAIYEQPASSCRPPTARPGRSQHERGLAIDFTYGGNTICFPKRSSSCRGNAAYNWLKANAWRYGLYNLPSEAWHWSTTGS